ncbi:MAG: metal-binding protein [Oscillatoria sp. SIO1A7]|nr:metal-binding protein [Oscillatoria sp. SIO1A7]
MPSGRVHDKITIIGLPAIAIGACIVTRSPISVFLISGGYLFGGFMFGPDLDIHSVQFKRWGWLKFIWLPYQKSIRHRSLLSHGPVIGTVLRVVYLAAWISVTLVLASALQALTSKPTLMQGLINWSQWLFLEKHLELLAVFVGIELGAASHYLADWLSSFWKRFMKKTIK